MGIISRHNMDGVFVNQPLYAIVSTALLGSATFDLVTFCQHLQREGCQVFNKRGAVALCNPDYLEALEKRVEEAEHKAQVVHTVVDPAQGRIPEMECYFEDG